MIFETTKHLNNWVREHLKGCNTKSFKGEQFVYEFVPMGRIQCQTVKCITCEKRESVNVD